MIGDATDSAAAAGNTAPRAGGKRGPSSTAEQGAALAGILAPAFGLATDLIEWTLQAPGLAMTEDEAEQVAAPAGRMLARTDSGKRFAKYLGTRGDAVQLAAALLAYGERVAPIAIERVGANVARRRMMQQERTSSGATFPTTGPARGRRGQRDRSGDAKSASPTGPAPSAAPAAAAATPAASNGHASNGFASPEYGGAPLAHVWGDPAGDAAASNVIQLYP